MVAVVALLGGLLLFYRSFLSGEILASYDLLTYFYPYQEFAAASLRIGRLPLWNPFIFLGAPFLANIQAAVLYPLSWPFLLLEAPYAVMSSLLLHLFIAGLCMYLFARRSMGLSPWGSLGAALPFMLGGYLSQKVGNPNQLQTLAWLPLLLLAMDRVVMARSLGWGIAGGLVLALQLLGGHTQMVYYSLWAAGLLLLFRGVGALGLLRRRWRAGLAMLSLFLLVIVLGVGLAAVQLLPTLELLGQSIRRGGLSFEEAVSFSLPHWELLRALLPPFSEPTSREFIGFVGFLPLALGLVALRFWLHPGLGYCLGLGFLALFLALGGFNPFYPWLHAWVPGLDEFRVPARWLLLWTFAVSLAAGIGLEGIARRRRADRLPWQALPGITLESLGLWAPLVLLVSNLTAHLILPPSPWPQVWAFGSLAALLLVQWGRLLAPGPWLAGLVLLLMLLELYGEGLSFDRHRLVPMEAYTSLRTTTLQLLAREPKPYGYRILSIASSDYQAGDNHDLRLSLEGRSPEQIEGLLAAMKYREILAPNLPMVYRIPTVDGYDGGLLPLERYIALRDLIVAGEQSGNSAPLSEDAVLRFLLHEAPDLALIGSLNVRYLVMDKGRDLWLENAYYDMAFRAQVTVERPLALYLPEPFEATYVGAISYLRWGAHLEQGTEVAQVMVEDEAGVRLSLPLRAGLETAEGERSAAAPRHGMARIAVPWPGQLDAFSYVARLLLPGPMKVRRLEIQGLQPGVELQLRSLTVGDGRTGASEPVTLDPRASLIASGDLKVYRLRTERPQGSIVHQYRVVADPAQAVAALAQEGGGGPLLVGRVPRWPADRPISPVKQEEVQVLSWSPERIVLRATLTERGFLLWRDAFFVGWQAVVDGQEGEVLPAYGVFRAIPLAAGEHQVELRYLPRSLWLGALVTLGVAVLALVLLAGRWFLARRALAGRRLR